MRIHHIVLALFVAAMYLPLSDSATARGAPRGKTLAAFHSEQELKAYLRELSAELRKNALERRRLMEASVAVASAPAASGAATESVTNTQHEGVDEGGIVKLHGEHMVMLRRGRLFTVSIANGSLRPVSAVNAFGPDINPDGTWYDELLVSDDKVVVIGYSYERTGTEIGIFRINSAGRLTYESTHHIRSNDYYSSRNYASRLIGNKLILYTPLGIAPTEDDLYAGFPALRKWRPGAAPQDFKRIFRPEDIYHLDQPMRGIDHAVLHTVTVCDLGTRIFDCKARGVMGQWGRVFYVSPQAVYVWMSGWSRGREQQTAPSMLYRLPLDGAPPTAVTATGSPVDQFSFNETEDGYLNVLVRSQSAGDWMWASEYSAGTVALLRIPIESFGDGSHVISRAWYRTLPVPPEDGVFQNRFVGDYLLYGTGSGWVEKGTPRSSLFAVHTRYGDLTQVPLPHGVDRIDVMGTDAIVIGTAREDLHFSGIRLMRQPARAQHLVLKQASQGELRSHGFFYKPEGRGSGVLGLPVRSAAEPGHAHLIHDSASVVFVRNTGSRFEQLGRLGARTRQVEQDGCQASCVDWYGNSRPLFLGGRMLALLGYEIVEGQLQPDGLREMRRISFAPPPAIQMRGSE